MCPDDGSSGLPPFPFVPQPAPDARPGSFLWRVAGIWTKCGDTTHSGEVKYDIDGGDFKRVTEGWAAKGYSITKLFSRDGLWGGIWRKGAPGAWAMVGLEAGTLAGLATLWHVTEHRHMVDLHYDADSGTYGAIWLAGDDGDHVETDVTLSRLKIAGKTQGDANRRLHRLKLVGSNFAGLWRSGDVNTVWGRSSSIKSFDAEIDSKRKKDWHLVDFDVSGDILNAQWLGLWHRGKVPHVVELTIPLEKFSKTLKDLHKKDWCIRNMALYRIQTTDGLTG